MAITGGSNNFGSLNSVPAPLPQALSSNYLDFTGGANDWSQQYLPDLMEKEAEVFGPRTISGFLSQVGAEEAMTADRVVWSEQGRLHLAYTGTLTVATSVFDFKLKIRIITIKCSCCKPTSIHVLDVSLSRIHAYIFRLGNTVF